MTPEAGEGIEEIPMHLDTVVFNTDAMQMDLVWRGLLEVVDWDAMHIATLFVIHEPLDAAPQTMDEVRALLAAQLVPLEVVEQEPEQDGDPANDVALPPVAAPEIDEANATAEQAHLDAQAAEQAQTEEAIEHQIGELQAKVDTARADAGLPSIDIRNPPATDAPDKNAMLAKLKKAGMSEAHMASLFGGSAGGAAPPPATMLANLKDDLGGLMKKAGLPQEKIDETMADFPELPEPPEPPEPPAVPDVKPAAVSEPDLSEREGVIAALERGDDFDGASLAGVDLSDLDFSGRSMKGAMLQGCDLSRSLFDGCDLSEAQLGGANLSSASFKVATLDEADLSGCVAEEACFDEASMAGCEGEAMLAQAARFVGATGKGLRLPAAQLNGACFDKAELPALDLTGATFDGASFEHAQVPKIRLYGATGTGARFSGADLSGARADGVCLPQAIFEKAIANDSVWEGAKLDGVSFLGSQLEKARFVGASLPGAIFSKARLRSACLDNATLTEASFLKTDLMGASFEGADLSHADLRGANLYGVASWRAKTEKINIEQAYVVNTQLGGRK
jgi:uncharacterized protein YjbI with pentapeptide repeats